MNFQRVGFGLFRQISECHDKLACLLYFTEQVFYIALSDCYDAIKQRDVNILATFFDFCQRDALKPMIWVASSGYNCGNKLRFE